MLDLGAAIRTIRDRLTIGGPLRAPDSPLPFVSRRPSVNPILPVADMVEAVGFYRSLGFTVDAYDDQYAWVKHCGWEFLHLRLVTGLEAVSNEATAYVHVADVDAWRSAMTAATNRRESVGEARDEAWGMREFSVADPSGNVVRFGRKV